MAATAHTAHTRRTCGVQQIIKIDVGSSMVGTQYGKTNLLQASSRIKGWTLYVRIVGEGTVQHTDDGVHEHQVERHSQMFDVRRDWA